MTSTLNHESALADKKAVGKNYTAGEAVSTFSTGTNPEIVWGAEAISRVTGEPDVRKTFYRLEKGLIPGAGKMGNRHFLSIPAFRRAVHGEAA